jgi:GH25 family lysozyme M1 (1,4-beta-N-acetylmuramidase)
MGHIGNSGRAVCLALAVFASCVATVAYAETRFHRAWKSDAHALVIDAYEFNEINLTAISKNNRVAAFINKASDGMPPEWGCKGAGNETERDLCKKEWRLYAVSKELYHTRRALAKALGLKWGAYHLGRPGNAIDQANHFIDFAEPAPDDLIAIDIEDIGSGKYISLADAEEFARHIYRRLGRYPVLYVNDDTAKHIARQRDQYPLLSRLQLWYARYKPEIVGTFPKGNWESYALWQFVSHLNCSARACPHRVDGAGSDIDINVASMDVKELKAAWPLGGLLPVKDPKSSKDFSKFLVASAAGSISSLGKVSASIAEALVGKATGVAFNDRDDPVLALDPLITASIRPGAPTGRLRSP